MFGFGPGFGGFFGVLGRLAEVLGTVVIAAVVVGVTVLLVRFLLVATRAAQLYVDRHELPKPATERRSYAPEPPEPAASVPIRGKSTGQVCFSRDVTYALLVARTRASMGILRDPQATRPGNATAW